MRRAHVNLGRSAEPLRVINRNKVHPSASRASPRYNFSHKGGAHIWRERWGSNNAIPARFNVMNALSDWPRNRLLLALPSRNLKRLMPELEHIRCHRGQVLMDADSSLDQVFFPDSGVVSVVAVYANGNVIEMATIGREGCTGMQAIFGAK